MYPALSTIALLIVLNSIVSPAASDWVGRAIGRAVGQAVSDADDIVAADQTGYGGGAQFSVITADSHPGVFANLLAHLDSAVTSNTTDGLEAERIG